MAFCPGRALAPRAVSLRRQQRQRPRNIGLGDEVFQTIQQLEGSQQRHQIAQSGGAGFFESFEWSQADPAPVRQFDLRQAGALRRNTPRSDRVGQTLSHFGIGQLM